MQRTPRNMRLDRPALQCRITLAAHQEGTARARARRASSPGRAAVAAALAPCVRVSTLCNDDQRFGRRRRRGCLLGLAGHTLLRVAARLLATTGHRRPHGGSVASLAARLSRPARFRCHRTDGSGIRTALTVGTILTTAMPADIPNRGGYSHDMCTWPQPAR